MHIIYIYIDMVWVCLGEVKLWYRFIWVLIWFIQHVLFIRCLLSPSSAGRCLCCIMLYHHIRIFFRFRTRPNLLQSGYKHSMSRRHLQMKSGRMPNIQHISTQNTVQHDITAAKGANCAKPTCPLRLEQCQCIEPAEVLRRTSAKMVWRS